VEDVAQVVRPVEEEFEEGLAEQEEAEFEGELLGEGVEVVVDEYEGSRNGEIEFAPED
jgi:hypothetical protein